MRVSRETWPTAIDAVREFANDPKLPVWACLVHYYQLCIPSVVSPQSLFAWQLYHDLDGFKHETFESYMRMPAWLVDAFHIIGGEIRRIEQVQSESQRGK
jgi:hypothetical protein